MFFGIITPFYLYKISMEQRESIFAVIEMTCSVPEAFSVLIYNICVFYTRDLRSSKLISFDVPRSKLASLTDL